MGAKHRQRLSYGVSVGVRSFVRPLYLHKKLHTLINRENDEVIPLNNVEAFKIENQEQQQQQQQQQHEHQYTPKRPCVTCQCLFDGFANEFRYPIGNCAEYDITGNVPRNLLETQPGQHFVFACQQHLNAFNAMNREILDGMLARQPRQILESYFNNAHSRCLKVLEYQWNSETKAFDLIWTIWPPRRRQHTVYS